MKLTLSREVEERLIRLGLESLLNMSTARARVPWNKGLKGNKSWSKEQRAKFNNTMRKKWADRKKAENA